MLVSRLITAAANLMNARLLASKQAVNRSVVTGSLKKFFDHRLNASELKSLWESAEREMRDGNLLVDGKKLQLTDDGWKSGLHLLGVEDLPASLRWQTLENRYLVPLALGLCLSEKERECIGQSEYLQGAIIAKHVGLSQKVPKVKQALFGIAWRHLGEDRSETIRPLRLAMLLIQREANPPIDQFDKLIKQWPAQLVGARTSRQIRKAIIQNWVFSDSAETALSTMSLDDFARSIQRLATSSASGRFGDNKVFISHVWQRFQDEGLSNGMTEDEFKQKLVEANRKQLLDLSRADVVELMPADDVAASEIQLPHSSFHFVRI